jgi:hypothetical protein
MKLAPIEKVFLFVAFVFFLLFSLWNIESPGLHYDEALFINAANGKIDNAYVHSQVLGIPVMIMSYIGALKSLIYIPIFGLFGVNYYSIRIPVILISLCAIIAVFFFVKKELSEKVAHWTAILLLLSPLVQMFARLDIGPTGISFLLQSLTLLVFAQFLGTKKKYNLVLIAILLSIGVWNKIHFIWFVNAFLVGVLFVYGKSLLMSDPVQKHLKPKELQSIILRSITKNLFFIIPFILPYLVFALIIIKWGSSIGSVPVNGEFLSLLLTKFLNLLGTISGAGFADHSIISIPVWISAIAICIALGVHFFAYVFKAQRPLPRIITFLWVIIAVILVQILITTQAVSIWHTFALFPMLVIVFASAIVQISARIQSAKVGYFFKGVIAIFFITQAAISAFVLQGYDHPTLRTWSNTISQLSEYTRKSNAKVAVIDWGIANQLRAFDPTPDKYTEIFWNITTTQDAENNINTFMNTCQSQCLFVTYDNGEDYIMTQGLKSVIQSRNLEISESYFLDGNRKQYIVYEVSNK